MFETILITGYFTNDTNNLPSIEERISITNLPFLQIESPVIPAWSLKQVVCQLIIATCRTNTDIIPDTPTRGMFGFGSHRRPVPPSWPAALQRH